jgi:hypothetical protein
MDPQAAAQALTVSGQQLTVAVLFWGSAVVIGLDALKHTGRRAKWLWLAVVGFVIVGFLVRPLWGVFPDVAGFLLRISTFAPTWFFLVGIAYLVLRERGRPSEPAAAAVSPQYDEAPFLERIGTVDRELRNQMDMLRDEFAAHKAHMDTCYSAQDEARLDGLNQMGVKVDGLRQDLEKWVAVQRDDSLKTREALHTIVLRERLAQLEAEIRQDASDLYDRLKGGEVYDEQKWRQWENVHGHWETKLNDWLGGATWYGLAVQQRTLTVDDEKYGAQWSVADTQFPNAEAVRRFKKFRIVQQQWESIVPEVRSGMEQVAFLGMTQLEVRHGQVAG